MIGESTIATLQPLSYSPVSINFSTAGYADRDQLEIYAVIDPDNTIAEMYEDFNTAFAVLPIKVDATYSLCRLLVPPTTQR